MTHGYDVAAESLAGVGVDLFFSLIGEDTATVVAAMVGDYGMRQVVARNESGAVLMADGFARVSGEVGVAVISRGPGLVNALTALTAVTRARNPVLVVVGDMPSVPHSPHMKEISHDDVIAVSGAELYRVLSIEEIPRVVREAYSRAAESRVVVLNLPVNLLEDEVVDRPVVVERDRGSLVVSHGAVYEPVAAVDGGSVGLVVERLVGAERPLIVGGRGAVAADAGGVLAEIGERVGAPLATSLLGKGVFDGQPLSVGIVGGFATKIAVEYATSADVVVVFGASLNEFTTQDGHLFEGAYVIRVDRAAVPAEPTVGVDQLIHADAGDFARAVLAGLPANGGEHPRTRGLRERLGAWTPESEIVDQSSGEGLDGELLAARFERLLPRERTVVIDGGRYCSYSGRTFSVRRSRDFHFTVNFGSMGLGMGTAVGAAFASGDQVTVLLIGDGGFMMTVNELETAVRYQLPLVVIVFNDRGFGSEMSILKRHRLPDVVARMPTPSLAEIGRAMGADGVTVERWEDLDSLADRFRNVSGPLVVDCRINPDADAISEFFERQGLSGKV